MNWPDSRLLDLLEIEHPILQAPMAGATNAQLAAAVSNAGALGAYGAAATAPDQLRGVIADYSGRTDRPWHVNLFAASTEEFDQTRTPGPFFLERLRALHDEYGAGALPAPRGLFGPAREQLAILLEARVPIVSFHFGLDPETVLAVQNAGSRVLCTATTVAEARALEDLGVDAIIAQGAEAGGHRGTFQGRYQEALIGTLALVPAIVDQVSIPVIAAGGIMDGRSIVAALALGAAGVQMGTAFLGCSEAPVNDAWRRSLDRATASDTVVTEAISGKPARGLRNRLVDELEGIAKQEGLLPYSAQYSMSSTLRQVATERNDPDLMSMWSGQGVDGFRRGTAAELVQQLVQEAHTTRSRLALRDHQ